MRAGTVRPIAICAFVHRDRILVFEGYDPVKDEVFYRPLGGTIEFGEYGHQTVVREFQEELGAEVVNVHYLGALENIFMHAAQPGHEIVLVYGGDFVDHSFYEREMLDGQEDDGSSFKAMWKPLDVFRRGETPLYPTGLLELLVT